MARVNPGFDPGDILFVKRMGGRVEAPAEAQRMDDRSLAQPRTTPGIARDHDGAMVSFTAATNWLNVKGFGRKANCWFSGRLFSKASSA